MRICQNLERKNHENFPVILFDLDLPGDNYFDGACDMELVIACLSGVFVGGGAVGLFSYLRQMQMRIAELEKKNEEIRKANKNHLPFQTAEELEHAKAAWILLQDDLQFKQSIIDNLGAHLDKARENKRITP